MEHTVLGVIGGIACALLLGGMVTFTAFFARQVFAKLPDETARDFIRAVFPSYYLLMAVFAAIGAAALAAIRPWDALALAIAAAGFVFAREWLMPWAQRLYAAREAGQPGAAERFARVHRQSALLNLLQMVAALGVLARLLAAGA